MAGIAGSGRGFEWWETGGWGMKRQTCVTLCEIFSFSSVFVNIEWVVILYYTHEKPNAHPATPAIKIHQACLSKFGAVLGWNVCVAILNVLTASRSFARCSEESHLIRCLPGFRNAGRRIRSGGVCSGLGEEMIWCSVSAHVVLLLDLISISSEQIVDTRKGWGGLNGVEFRVHILNILPCHHRSRKTRMERSRSNIQ